MKTELKTLFALAGMVIATQVAAQVTFYENDDFRGRSFATQKQVRDFGRYGFNDRASSVNVTSGRWEVCESIRFAGHCVVLRPGRYPSLTAMGLNDRVSSARSISRNTHIDDQRYAPAIVQGEVTLYEREGFGGQSFTSDKQIENFQRQNFNDRASSVVVHSGIWEVCEDSAFRGRCFVLRPGQYPSLASMGLNDRVSSVRLLNGQARIDEDRYAPAPVADYRRRNDERLFEAPVTSVHAVVGPPQQRCWVEQEQVAQDRTNNMPATIAGAVIGGILGHQVGGGSGKDLATIGGAVAGAAVGANVGRNNNPQPTVTQNVRRCESIPNQARPEFWDVTYSFRGQAHRVQMTTPPGATVTVNGQGEPRS
jgi:uncharacterized protein YcfJ